MPGQPYSNPFIMGPLPSRKWSEDELASAFAGRNHEVATVRSHLEASARSLVLHGPRRMGKSWVLERAVIESQQRGHWTERIAIKPDRPAAAAATLMESLHQAPGRGRPRNRVLKEMLDRELHPRMSGDPDSTTPFFQVFKDAKEDLIVDTLFSLDAALGRSGMRAAIAIDEFQFLGPAARQGLRAFMKETKNVSLVLTGSDSSVNLEMASPQGSLKSVANTLACGPINPHTFAEWIVGRAGESGVIIQAEAAAHLVELAGPTTWNIVRLASKTWEVGNQVTEVQQGDVDRVFESEVDLAALERSWHRRSPEERVVLEKVASARHSLPDLKQDGGAVSALIDACELLEVDGRMCVEDPALRHWLTRATR
jgi:hypothetical protein